jgi:hypothetical protein
MTAVAHIGRKNWDKVKTRQTKLGERLKATELRPAISNCWLPAFHKINPLVARGSVF